VVRVSISEARRRLPQLVRQVKQDRGSVVQITVRDEVVAELRAALPAPEPGAAARALLELARKLPRPRGPRRDISGHVKAATRRTSTPALTPATRTTTTRSRSPALVLRRHLVRRRDHAARADGVLRVRRRLPAARPHAHRGASPEGLMVSGREIIAGRPLSPAAGRPRQSIE
jgi:hypothetical protein